MAIGFFSIGEFWLSFLYTGNGGMFLAYLFTHTLKTKSLDSIKSIVSEFSA